MQRGIYYLAEASTSLLLMSLFIMATISTQAKTEKTEELYITQCLHDLLKARFIERNPSITEMESDFRHLFPGKSGFVEVNNARIEIGSGGEQAISASAIYYSHSKKSRLRALVFLD